MRKAVRAAAVVVAASLAVPLWGVPAALAEETQLTPSADGYFNSDGIRKPDDSPAPLPNATSDNADGVAPGHMAVAARAGSENKVSFMLFDLFELDPTATVTKAVLTVPLAPDGDGNASIAPAPEKVIACPAGEGGFFGDDGTSLQDAPERLCDQVAVTAVATADGAAYTFDLTALAQTWVSEANDGVALTSAPDARTSPFQVVFKPAADAQLAVTYTPGAGSELPEVPPLAPADTFVPDSGSADLGGSIGSDFAPAPDAGFGAVEEPVLSAEEPIAAPETAAEEPVAAPEVAATVPAASSMPSSLTPTTSFWIGLLLLAALLALLSLILGDPRIAQASTRQSRLSQALQARQRAAGSGATSRPVLGV